MAAPRAPRYAARDGRPTCGEPALTAASEASRAKGTLSASVFGAALWNTLLLPAKAVVSLVTSIVYYSGILPHADVGMIFLLQGLANTLGVYVDLGIERTLPRFLPEVDHARGRSGVRRLLVRSLLVKLLVLLPVVAGLFLFSDALVRALAERQVQEAPSSALPGGAPLFAGALPGRRLLLCGTVAGLVVLGAFHDVFLQALNAFFRRREWNTITLTSGLLQPALVTGAVLAGAGLPGVLVALLATAGLGLVLSARAAYHVVRELPRAETQRPLAPVLPRFARFAALSWVIQLTGWLYDLPLLVLFAAREVPLARLALLGFAYKFARDFVLYVTAPLVGVLTPALVRVKTRDSFAALQDAQASLTRILWLLVLPSGLGLGLLAPRIVAILYPEYAEASSLAVLFVAFVFAEPLLSVPQTVAMVCERYRAVLMSRVLALASIPLLLVLTPRFGLPGAAVAVGVARILPPLALVFYTSRAMGLRPPLAFLGRVAASSAGLAVFLLGGLAVLPSPGVSLSWAPRFGAVLPLAGLALLGGVVFLLLLRGLGGLEPEDRRRLFALNLPGKDALARLI